MLTKKMNLVLVACFCFFMNIGISQSVQNVSVSLTTESIAFPFTRLFPIHPGAEIGVGLWEVNKEKSDQFFNVHLGFYYHENISTSAYLRGEYQYQYRIHEKIGVYGLGGLGYNHMFFPSDLYTINSETGEAELVQQLGRPSLNIDAGLGLKLINSSPIQPFLTYRFSIQTPFANGFPIMPHSFLQVGATYQF